MDMQHWHTARAGKTDMPHGQEAWTWSSLYFQFFFIFMWFILMFKQQVHATWTCSVDMQGGHATRTRSVDMQRDKQHSNPDMQH
jgi:hypothetical protein